VLLHYLKIAVRNIRRAPVTAAINVMTLSLGLVCFVSAYAVISYWKRSDGHFENADRIYVITANLDVAEANIQTGTMPTTNDIYAGATWDQPSGTLVGVYNEGGGEVSVASSLEMVPSGINAATGHAIRVETWATARGLLLGKGWGRFANYGHIDATTEGGLETSTNVGMRFDKRTSSAGETLEIFDFVVYERRPA